MSAHPQVHGGLAPLIRRIWRWASAHWIDIAIVLLLVAGLLVLGKVMAVPASDYLPNGTWSIQFIGTRSHALLLRHALPDHVRQLLIAGLIADAFVIAAYVIVLRRAVAWLNRRLIPDTAQRELVHRFAEKAPWMACFCDVAENLCLLVIFSAGTRGVESIGLLSAIATVATLAKWTLLVHVLAYLICGGVRWAGRSLSAFRVRAAAMPSANGTSAASAADGTEALAVLASAYDDRSDRQDPDAVARTSLTSLIESLRNAVADLHGRQLQALRSLMASDSPGRRLAAIMLMQSAGARPDARWLLDRVLKDEPVLAHHAAAAMLAHLPDLSSDDKALIADALKAVRHDGPDVGRQHAQRSMLIEQILTFLDPKAGTAAAAPAP